MAGQRIGRLGVCTQPLFTYRPWLRDWVEYQFLIGADEVIMHRPQVVPVLQPMAETMYYFMIQISAAKRVDSLVG